MKYKSKQFEVNAVPLLVTSLTNLSVFLASVDAMLKGKGFQLQEFRAAISADVISVNFKINSVNYSMSSTDYFVLDNENALKIMNKIDFESQFEEA